MIVVATVSILVLWRIQCTWYMKTGLFQSMDWGSLGNAAPFVIVAFSSYVAKLSFNKTFVATRGMTRLDDARGKKQV